MNRRIRKARTGRQWLYNLVRHVKRYYFREIAAMCSEWIIDFIKKWLLKQDIYLLMIQLENKRRKE